MPMRYKTHRWLCSLIFCCAGLGMAQTSSTSDSAPQSQSVESSISASVNASANAGGSEIEVSGSGSRSGNSASRSVLSTAGASEAFTLQTGRGASPSASMNAFAELRTGRGNRSLMSRNPRSANRQSAAARDSGKPVKQASGIDEAASYSADFADSTKGTALISPPDAGTASPLDWTPGLNFGFADFQQTQFLNPTLQPRKGGRARNRKAAPGHILNEPALPTSIDEQLGFKAPSIDQDILGPALPTSIDEQLGLQ